MLTAEVPAVDGLVVRNPVTQSVKALHSARYISADLAGIVAGWMPRKDRCKARHPHRRVIWGLAQEAPESKVQLGDHTAMCLAASPATSGTLPSSFDIDSCARGAPTGEQVRLPIPRCVPGLDCAVTDERLIDGVAKHDLKPPEVLVERCCRSEVPVVERDGCLDIASDCTQVRAQPTTCEAIGEEVGIWR